MRSPREIKDGFAPPFMIGPMRGASSEKYAITEDVGAAMYWAPQGKKEYLFLFKGLFKKDNYFLYQPNISFRVNNQKMLTKELTPNEEC